MGEYATAPAFWYNGQPFKDEVSIRQYRRRKAFDAFCAKYHLELRDSLTGFYTEGFLSRHWDELVKIVQEI